MSHPKWFRYVAFEDIAMRKREGWVLQPTHPHWRMDIYGVVMLWPKEGEPPGAKAEAAA